MKVLIVNPSVYVEGKQIPEGEFECEDAIGNKLIGRKLAAGLGEKKLEVATPKAKAKK